MPDNVTPERTQLLQMYGAEIVYSPGDAGLQRRGRDGAEMAPRTLVLHALPVRQPANPRAHYTARRRDPRGARRTIAAFVAGLGTGGTLMGNGRRFKEELGDRVKIVAAEPMQGEPVQGLRSLDDGFIPPIIDLALLDRKIFVTNHDAIVWTRRLLDEEGSSRASRPARSPRSPCGSRRARRGQRRLHRLRRRLEVPLERIYTRPVDEIEGSRPPSGGRRLRGGVRSGPCPDVGPMELIVILVIALIVLGPKKLPEVGRSIGKGMREFKDSLAGDDRDEDERPAIKTE
jgi:cysteine synthase B